MLPGRLKLSTISTLGNNESTALLKNISEKAAMEPIMSEEEATKSHCWLFKITAIV